jgi:hypothetical protein
VTALGILGVAVYALGGFGIGVWAGAKRQGAEIMALVIIWPAALVLALIVGAVVAPYALGLYLTGGKSAVVEAWEEMGKGDVC